MKNMDFCQLTAAVTALANALAQGRSIEETALLGTVLSQLGDTLQTIAARRSLCEK